MSEIFNSDMAMFKKINELICHYSNTKNNTAELKEVKLTDSDNKNKKKNYRYLEYVIIEPIEKLGDMLDTMPATLDKRRNIGYEDAEKAFSTDKKWNACKPTTT
jgi:hypothetical protein